MCYIVYITSSDLVSTFKSDGFIVSGGGGSYSKRHVLSYLNIWLNLYLIAIYQWDSVQHRNDNDFGNLDKSKYSHKMYIILVQLKRWCEKKK